MTVPTRIVLSKSRSTSLTSGMRNTMNRGCRVRHDTNKHRVCKVTVVKASYSSLFREVH